MCKIIDFHTHAFPDPLAARAVGTLEKDGNTKAFLNGTISSLLESMNDTGIGRSVVCSIATRPSQFESIFSWSLKCASERIIPFPSFHPKDLLWRERIEQIKAAGFKGIKLHPYYQDFNLNDDLMMPMYERMAQFDLILVVHTGFDIAFPREKRADPEKVLDIAGTIPMLKLVTTHLGAWDDWSAVKRHLVGRDIHMELSFSLDLLDSADARYILTNHPVERILFGTDSPWTDQGETLRRFKRLGLGKERERLILAQNAKRLLDIV